MTKEAHKLLYVIRNKKKKTSKQIIILPFLHERKIYLHKADNKSYYFQTTYKETVSNKENQEGNKYRK